jgi:DMSO/TMAO reductase YedYZ molybdopterin-dependent catalytic subunit
MKKVTIQLVVATIITVAFVLTAVSGLVLYVPGRLIPVFGLSLLTWRVIHEWAALALTVAVVAHIVLNRRRVGEMVAGLWRPAGSPRTAAAPAPAHGSDTRAPAPSRTGDAASDDAEPVAATAAASDGGQPVVATAAASDGGQPVVATAPDEGRLRYNRRWFLLLAAGAVAALIAVLGLERGSSRSGGSGPGSGPADFPVLNIESRPPAVSAADWVVDVDGLVDSPLHLERSAWLALPRTQETRDFHCVEGWSVDRLGWEGVRVADLLSLAKPQGAGQFVTFHAAGGAYSDSLALAEARAPETLLADSLDAAPLSAAHGGPLRLVVPSQLGYKNVKWVVRLEVTATRAQGYWERNGDYPSEAPVS